MTTTLGAVILRLAFYCGRDGQLEERKRRKVKYSTSYAGDT